MSKSYAEAVAVEAVMFHQLLQRRELCSTRDKVDWAVAVFARLRSHAIVFYFIIDTHCIQKPRDFDERFDFLPIYSEIIYLIESILRYGSLNPESRKRHPCSPL